MAGEPSVLPTTSLLESFLSEGIPVTPKISQLLPPPLLSGTEPIAARKLKLEQLAVRHGWERFSRPSAMAPIHVQLEHINDSAGKRIGHHVYSAFIVRAPLATLKDQELMESLFGAKSENGEQIGFQPERLPSEILAKVGIVQLDNDSVRFSTIYLPLMNRIALRGTAHVERAETENSALIAWQFEPRFTFASPEAGDGELGRFSNHYVKIQRDELGREVEALPVPYMGCGGYLSVQETGLEPDQLLIESRLVLHEPPEWFAGSNFLRSKFPTVLQESAQSFRRRVMKPN